MSELDFVVRSVGQLPAGKSIEVSGHLLKLIGSARLKGIFGPVWSPVDLVMERIVGSAFTIMVYENPMTNNVTFSRIEEQGEFTWISPDQREGFRYDGRFFRRIGDKE